MAGEAFLFCTESLKEKPIGTMYSLVTGTNVGLILFANIKKSEGCVMWEHCGKRILLVSN